jgi:hypothetical protein
VSFAFESRLIKISEERWAELHELCGDAWHDEGHRYLVIDTLLDIAIPIQRDKLDGELLDQVL